jgi:ATP-dependent Zn protease
LTPTRALGQRIADAADSATGRIVDECYARAVDLLTRERQRLVKLAEELLRSESLDEQQIRAVTGLTADSHPESPVAAAR